MYKLSASTPLSCSQTNYIDEVRLYRMRIHRTQSRDRHDTSLLTSTTRPRVTTVVSSALPLRPSLACNARLKTSPLAPRPRQTFPSVSTTCHPSFRPPLSPQAGLGSGRTPRRMTPIYRRGVVGSMHSRVGSLACPRERCDCGGTSSSGSYLL